LHPQQNRQGGRHEQHIVEMKPQEGIVSVRLEPPTIQHVQGTGNEKQSVAEIPKPFHNKTKIAKPRAVATSSFKTNIMPATLTHIVITFQNFF
jgi:hypothetical protein